MRAYIGLRTIRLPLFDGGGGEDDNSIQTVQDTYKWKNDLAVDLFSKDEATKATVLLIWISFFPSCLFFFFSSLFIVTVVTTSFSIYLSIFISTVAAQAAAAAIAGAGGLSSRSRRGDLCTFWYTVELVLLHGLESKDGMSRLPYARTQPSTSVTISIKINTHTHTRVFHMTSDDNHVERNRAI